MKHETSKTGTDTWLTPPAIIEAIGLLDLDPCAAPKPRPWDTAKNHYTLPDEDGLINPWEGSIWLNPPYGQDTWMWLNKLALHGDGIALIFARTETEGFQRFVFGSATAILFIKGRLRFLYPDGKPAKSGVAPSVLVAYGEENAVRLEQSGIQGQFMRLKSKISDSPTVHKTGCDC